jgi:hypothetical protein
MHAGAEISGETPSLSGRLRRSLEGRDDAVADRDVGADGLAIKTMFSSESV